MSYEKLVARLGFLQDPFASWDADAEDRLQDYFIKPPFFNAVYGEPEHAGAAVVFAPRGGGKTALRRMVEISSPADEVICVTYSHFPTNGRRLADIDLDYHLKNVIVLALIGVVSYLLVDERYKRLSQSSRKQLYMLLRGNLSSLRQAELGDAIRSVRSLSQTAREWWNNTLKVANPILSAVAVAFSFPPVELQAWDAEKINLGSALDQLAAIREIANEVGATSIYVLADRVDENELTGNDAGKAFTFIAPMLQNLNVLQLNGYGFKFFLWDLLKDAFNEHCRADRIKTFELHWSIAQLKSMLASRLSAYSEGKHSSLAAMVDYDGHLDLDEIVSFFGARVAAQRNSYLPRSSCATVRDRPRR